jgi:hypothetical protein
MCVVSLVYHTDSSVGNQCDKKKFSKRTKPAQDSKLNLCQYQAKKNIDKLLIIGLVYNFKLEYFIFIYLIVFLSLIILLLYDYSLVFRVQIRVS